MTLIWLLGAALFLAYTNGANDNFKGVATLFGSRTAGYRRALWWATATTLAGSLSAVLLSGGLIKAFSGNGLVPAALTHEPIFLLAVGLGAALTVLAATVMGLPISTTHALTGALVGAGLASGGSVSLGRLGHAFFLPLAVSPFLSFMMTGVLYPVLRGLRVRLGVERQMCLCVDGGTPQTVLVRPDGTAVLSLAGARDLSARIPRLLAEGQATGVALSVGQMAACRAQYHGRIIGIDAQRALDRLHYLSAGAVSFARGLNDTPKIAALLMAAPAFGVNLPTALAGAGVAMGVGGLLNARKVAKTMSHRITAMNHGQGFTANLVTACLVTMASRFGLPVSTTHVSCGSLFGLGTVTGGARWGMIRAILLAWLVTLPLAACLAAVVMGFQRFAGG